MSSKRNLAIIIFGVALTLVALFFQYKALIQTDLNAFIKPVLFWSMAIFLFIIVKVKDLKMKTLVFISLISLGFSYYFFGSIEQEGLWFLWASLCGIIGYLLLMIAGRLRNFKSMELSTMRQHPWISAILMAGGVFLFKDIELYLSGKKLILILFITSALISSLVIIERNKQVAPKSFRFLLLGVLLSMVCHSALLHSLFHRSPDFLSFLMTSLVGFSAMFIVLGAKHYEDGDK